MVDRFRTNLVVACAVVALAIFCTRAHGFGYIFASEFNGVDIVTHPMGYSGIGGTLNVTVGIDPSSPNASEMVIPTKNVVATWNAMQPTLSNANVGALGGTEIDFESVLLHELGHSIGLAHVNAALESGLTGADRNYTKTTNGANNTFDLDAGPDGVRGSHDDLRGDDVNLNYFRIADNDPFDTNLGVVDSTTYSRDTADLPPADAFSANADRSVSQLARYAAPGTEAVMQQGTFFSEIQRTLAADDVAGILYAEAGLDELAGTADDYDLLLQYAGQTTSAEIVIAFDNSETGFAVSKSSRAFIAPDHYRVADSDIFFNTGYDWHFNDTLIPEPASAFLLGAAGLALLVRPARPTRKR